ncbi:PEP-CTERM sorting domain-containing protein [bacterium]|nr:PEP-CTERM sorting domain-containing protein [bacterium]
MFESEGIDLIYYYVGFDSPVAITNIKLDNGTNTDIDYDLTFYAYPGNTVPEPATIILLGMGMLSIARRLKKK